MQFDGPWFVGLRLPRACFSFDFKVVVNCNAVVQNGDSGVASLVAFGVELRRSKGDVVGLPLQGRQAHVLIGTLISIQRTAFVFDAFQPERIEYLDFVAA